MKFLIVFLIGLPLIVFYAILFQDLLRRAGKSYRLKPFINYFRERDGH